MRWQVETKPFAGGTQSNVVVEAESWQRALQSVRASRGEPTAISGFTVEFAGSSYRASDPISRRTYVVSNAADDASLSDLAAVFAAEKAAAADEARADADEPSSTEASDAAANAIPIVPPAAGSRPGSGAAVPRPSAREASAALLGLAGKRPFKAPQVIAKEPPPAAASATLVDASPPPDDVLASVGREPLEPDHTDPMQKALDPDATDETAAPLSPPSPLASNEPPPVQVLFRRAQEPTKDTPLHYRELVLALPPGTSDDVAEEVLWRQLAEVQAELATHGRGKVVNLAVFDEVFTTAPKQLPLATLTWKDWRGEPTVDRPRRRGSASPAVTMSLPPDLSSAPDLSNVAVPPPSNVPRFDPPPPAAPSDPVNAAQISEPALAREGDSDPSDETDDEEDVPTPPPALNAHARRASDPRVSAASAADPIIQDAEQHDTIPPDTSATPGMMASLPPPPKAPAIRRRADSLVDVLFEAMHDLAFLRDAKEGAEFCLALALEELPAGGAVVHLYDMQRRLFEAVATRGAAAEGRLQATTPDGDPRFRAAVRASMLPPGASSAPAAKSAVDAGSLLAPIVKDGRYMGAIELLAPTDGMPFGDAELSALTYIASQYADFLSTRGVVFGDQPPSVRIRTRRR